MALHSKKDFAALCGLSSGNLANNITRGKVITSGAYIDDKVEKNAAFLAKWSAKKAAKESGTVIEKPTTEPPEKKEKPVAPPNIQPPVEFQAAPNVKAPLGVVDFELELERKRLANRQMRLMIEKAELANEKTRGQTIPTEMVGGLMLQHSKSITIEFKNGAESVLTDLIRKHNLDREEAARLRELLTTTINTAVENSIANTKRMIKNIVQEYSQKRGVGEHS